MAVGMTNFQIAYKTFYDADTIKWLTPKNAPFLAMVPRKGGLSGDIIDHPFLYGAAAGYSSDFSVAQTQAGNAPRGLRATLRCSQGYSMAEFWDKDKELSDGDASYIDTVTATLQSKMQNMLTQLDIDLHGSGTGFRGLIGAIPGGTNPLNGATLGQSQVYITQGMGLETVFDQDQQLQFATYAGYPLTVNGVQSIFPPSDGRLPTTLSNPVVVQAVDAANRVLTLSDASAATVSSFVVQAGGAIGFNSSNTYGALIGMDSWVPYGGPQTGENFCSISRSVYPTRLCGYYFDGSKLSMMDAIKRLSARMSQGGATSSSICLVNPLDFDAMDSSGMNNVRVGSISTYTHGFDSIVINGAAGRIDIVADPHQMQGYARLIDPETWLLHHALDLPHIVDVDGKTMEQGGNFDGRTCRIRFYAQLRCLEPQKNGIVKLAQVNV